MTTAHVEEELHGNVLEVHIHGRLTRDDYQRWVPDSERLIRLNGRLRMLIYLEDFKGWDPGAMWEEIKWDLKHYNDIERLAIVGEARWHRWMATMCKPFTTAEVRFFELWEVQNAKAWLGID